MAQSISTAHERLSVPVRYDDLDEPLDREWLLTNSLGSYSSGSLIGTNTRRYHGLLVASMCPPVERYVVLSNVLETVLLDGRQYDLATFEFSNVIHPEGYRSLGKFEQDEGVHFLYQFEACQVRKSLYLARDSNQLILTYSFTNAPEESVFTLSPMVTLRDFHGLQSSSAAMHCDKREQGVSVRHEVPGGPVVHIRSYKAQFKHCPDLWYGLHYREDRQRGQDCVEDAFVPGTFHASVAQDDQISFVIQVTECFDPPEFSEDDIRSTLESLKTYRRQLGVIAGTADEVEEILVHAADQFVVRRRMSVEGREVETASILAGYHWFADWGRDTFIALPGLLLCTGRHSEACEVLSTFASVVSEGQIPNRFDDYGGPPHYNSVDASLWYINAAYQYLLKTGDQQTYDELLMPTLQNIVAHYQEGTRDGIHADQDGLLTAGDCETQLTWMDAKCNGVAFTPRYGKAVEVNALWVNALRILASTLTDESQRNTMAQQADAVEQQFQKHFWNQSKSCLYDCIYPDGTADGAIRPNQIFAVSLPFSGLSHNQQVKVTGAVRRHLLTDYGLRSLGPDDLGYVGRYVGDQFQRDSSYHQGTVWSYLIGPFVEAWLKVNRFSDPARKEARRILEPLKTHLIESGCVGSLSEIFDGYAPHKPRGCIAQAWSVAEFLRGYQLAYHE